MATFTARLAARFGDVHGDVGEVGGEIGDVPGDVGEVGGEVGDVHGNVGNVGNLEYVQECSELETSSDPAAAP